MTRRRNIAAAVGLLAGSACGHQPVTVQTVGTTSTSSPSTTEAPTTTEAPATTAPTTSAPAVTAPPSPPSTAGAEPTPPTTVRRTTTEAPAAEVEPGSVEAAGDVWWQLALCESGGTNANTGNGYYGYLQFLPSTWRSVGEVGLPTDYGYEHQIAAGQRLQARSGWAQWPACSQKLGLR